MRVLPSIVFSYTSIHFYLALHQRTVPHGVNIFFFLFLSSNWKDIYSDTPPISLLYFIEIYCSCVWHFKLLFAIEATEPASRWKKVLLFLLQSQQQQQNKEAFLMGASLLLLVQLGLHRPTIGTTKNVMNL